ncbi:MAG: hypothetical protein A2231_00680 [Candidatus Firestonebacteria bacterium RIFOXYA2_FULL_40_8]|nr:MAG: hypothetical protein A2231_00680 [Candidatus Firestonebacteria bacterium RIFOXYA2_FULL_40_8]
MTNRKLFLDLINGEKADKIPFFPDITVWYQAQRVKTGTKQKFGPGALIPDKDSIHSLPGTMPEKFKNFTFLDFYRKFNWGCPIHLYHWYDNEYKNVSYKTSREGEKVITTMITPLGELQQVNMLAADGSSAKIEHYVKKVEDLEIIKYAVANTKIITRYDIVEQELKEIGELGVGDLVISRSPFGKLVHEYMGMETLVYAMADYPEKVEEFMKFQETYDLEVVKLAAAAPVKLVIISDHSDENLIAPPYYKKYCIPYYQKVCAILHEKEKKVSSHLDGNFKGYFPYLQETGFDLMDGCTPYPMNNYKPAELMAALGKNQYTYCGVPCTLFVQDLKEEVVLDNARSIINSLKGKLILNIGDIMPANGKIDLLLKVSELVEEINKY